MNKVNTKVDMRLSLDSEWISEDMQDALQRLVSGLMQMEKFRIICIYSHGRDDVWLSIQKSYGLCIRQRFGIKLQRPHKECAHAVCYFLI